MIVKVCGMREPQNIRDVEDAGVQWMGFIFYPPSPRFVSSVPEYLPEKVKRVGVFVNAGYDEIMERVREFSLEIVQLHGSETPELCRTLRSGGIIVVKAFAVESEGTFQRVASYEGSADYFLFDTPCTSFGGCGMSFDWSILCNYRGKTPFILSGGLRKECLEALCSFRHSAMAGIDLNSGFELSPAVKDVALLRDFLAEYRKTFPSFK